MTTSRYLEKARSSSEWAIFGDALGFMTELGDATTVRWRTGDARVEKLRSWKRTIGGIQGTTVSFPRGTYSDDTQLRICTMRAISTDGYFDVESFAKIELPVWLSYALGGGRGTKTAAANLTKRNINWFSNFFEQKSVNYFHGGGNGAAMRIQPHVWSQLNNPNRNKLILDVLRNSIVTHGHPRGFLGAVFHSLCLEYSFSRGVTAGPAEWFNICKLISEVPEILKTDIELRSFWLPVWQEKFGVSIEQATDDFLGELSESLETASGIVDSSSDSQASYRQLLESLGGYAPETSGSGLGTTVIASALAWLYRNKPVQNALVLAANEVGSDTDTIATMAGAVLGVNADALPEGLPSDSEYINDQVSRLVERNTNLCESTLSYPDVSKWSPPKNQASAVVSSGGQMAVLGLGLAEPISEPIAGKSKSKNQWQWVCLEFGQVLLIKRNEQLASIESLKKQARDVLPEIIFNPALSGPQNEVRAAETEARGVNTMQLSLITTQRGATETMSKVDIESLSAEAIKSGFDERVIGAHLLFLADKMDSIELVVAYAAIIAKARVSRNRHGKK